MGCIPLSSKSQSVDMPIVGIRSYNRFMHAFRKQDTTNITGSVGLYGGYRHHYDKAGYGFGIANLGWDYFWTRHNHRVHSLSLGYDAYLSIFRLNITAGLGLRYFIKNPDDGTVKDFEYEFGGGLYYRAFGEFDDPYSASVALGVTYRKIGRNNLLCVGAFVNIPMMSN
jgi:hypothetical protein